MAESRALVPYEEAQPGAERRGDDDLERLIRYYEEAEEAQYDARTKAERDRDYVDNKQLTDDEVRKLQRRGQPPISLNVIRSRAAFMAGLEKKQRRDPKAYPRNNPEDVNAAEAFTDGMRYVVETADYASKRSQAWRNIIVEGYGGLELAAIRKRDGFEFTIARIPWDRAFYDPHSAEPDFSDARYLGQVLWMDFDEALARAVSNGYVDEKRAREVLETTLASAPTQSRTFDDKPKWKVWADGKRKRVRLVMMWHREPSGWKYCEFTNGGKLAYAEAPYVDQDGESYCPWIFESANVDRDNNRYGEVRHLIDPQDEINKRRSKALHQSISRGVIAESGAVEDENKVRRELTKPDFYIEVAPMVERFEIVDGQQLAAGQVALLQDAMNYIMQSGPNAALLGKGVEEQSGRAIEAQQAGGLVEQSDLMDTLRRMDWRVFKVIASMIKQFWDAPKWIRVTDDDDAPKWVGLNEPMLTDPMTGRTESESVWRQLLERGDPVDPSTLQRAVDPMTGQPMLANDVARLDMDILISDSPDTIVRSAEWKQGIMQMLASGAPPPMIRLAIEIEDSIRPKEKKRILDLLETLTQQPPDPAAQDAQRLDKEMAEAKIAETRSKTYKNLTSGEKTMAEVGARMPLPDVGAGMSDEPIPPQGGPPMPPEGPPGPPPGPEMATPEPGSPPGPMPPDAPPPGMMTGGPLAA